MMLAVVFKRLFFLSILSYMHKIQQLMCLLPFYHMCDQEIDNNIDHITMLVDIQLRRRSLGQIPTFKKNVRHRSNYVGSDLTNYNGLE